MANYKHIIPFIKKAEGGLSKDTNDSASANPVPDGSGYHTNKGITWITWSGVFGITPSSRQRFYTMTDDDWGLIFKPFYWDVILGDKINSQKVADCIVDWVWGSGKHYPELLVQEVLNHFFSQHIGEDGTFGNATVASINSVDENELYKDIIQKHSDFYNQLVIKNPKNSTFINGWKNRLANLTAFEG